MIGGYSLPDESSFWLFTACLLVSLLRQDGRKLAFTSASYRELATELLGELH